MPSWSDEGRTSLARTLFAGSSKYLVCKRIHVIDKLFASTRVVLDSAMLAEFYCFMIVG